MKENTFEFRRSPWGQKRNKTVNLKLTQEEYNRLRAAAKKIHGDDRSLSHFARGHIGLGVESAEEMEDDQPEHPARLDGRDHVSTPGDRGGENV